MVINPARPGPCSRCGDVCPWVVADGPLDGLHLCDPCQDSLLQERLGPEAYAQMRADLDPAVKRGQDSLDKWLSTIRARLHPDL